MIGQSTKLEEKDRLVLLAYLQYLGGSTSELETTVRSLAKLHHHSVDYLRLLLFASSMREGKTEVATAALNDRWAEIAPNATTWSDRLRQGDLTAWQEMLVGYFLDKPPAKRIFAPLADPEQFAASPLSAAPASRSSYRADYFYDAQLQSVTGDQQTRRERQIESLHRAVASGPVMEHEYFLARYQLRALGARP